MKQEEEKWNEPKKFQKIDIDSFKFLKEAIDAKIIAKINVDSLKEEIKVLKKGKFQTQLKAEAINENERFIKEQETIISNSSGYIEGLYHQLNEQNVINFLEFYLNQNFKDFKPLKPLILWKKKELPHGWFESIPLVLVLSFVSSVINSDLTIK